MASKNKAFARLHPDFVLPPDYLMYESFRIDYEKYYRSGRMAASWLLSIIRKYQGDQTQDALDWGCGPARIIRHLPELAPTIRWYGSDYNSKSIEWFSANLPTIVWKVNQITPPLDMADNSLDVVYGFSRFTHLSATNHELWAAELHRVLRSGGLAIVSTQGHNFLNLLTESEKKLFNKGQLVIRGQVLEGHRTYSAFHPPQYINKLFYMFKVIEHQIDTPNANHPLPQDIWILQKP
jgi:SAM-dependent methyltransferase